MLGRRDDAVLQVGHTGKDAAGYRVQSCSRGQALGEMAGWRRGHAGTREDLQG